MVISTPKHFSVDQCISSFQRSDKDILVKVDKNSVSKVIKIGKSPILLQLNIQTPIKLVHKSDNSKNDLLIKEYVEEWLDLSTDLEQFYKVAHEDSILKPIVSKHQNLRLTRIPDLFETLSWAIIGQQVNLTFAYQVRNAFIETFGTTHEFDGKSFHTFPDFEKVAHLKVDDLLPMKFSRRKAEYVIGCARLMESGELSKSDLKSMEFQEAHDHLVSIRGIGAWTANYVMLRCLGFTDAYPAGDSALKAAIKLSLGKEQLSLEEIYEVGERWKGWRGYATLYLWRSLSD
ncbi:MAG: DNA-3-methyladenine glycosylase [Bacteroidota bacterium]